MRSLRQVAVSLLGAALVSGCFDSTGAPTGPLLEVLKQQASLPQSVPAEILAVQAHPEAYAGTDNPLAAVGAGTVKDALDQMDGCWARYETNVFSEAGVDYHEESIAVLKVDLRSATYQRHMWAHTDPLLPPWSSPTILVTTVGRITRITDNEVLFEGQDFSAGAIGDDGTISFDWGTAAAGSMNATTDFPALVTVAGDYLSMREGAWDQSAGDLRKEGTEEPGVLWRRIDCQ